MRYAIILFLVTVLGACSSGSALRERNETQIGQYRVQWAEVPALSARVPDGLTPLMFNFSDTSSVSSNGVTQADWEREAARRGTSVEIMRITLGSDPYLGPDGQLRVCTINAIQNGLCGQRLGLSVDERVELARRAIAESGSCAWVGFDPAYNAMTSFNLGAEDFTLHVAARC